MELLIYLINEVNHFIWVLYVDLITTWYCELMMYLDLLHGDGGGGEHEHDGVVGGLRDGGHEAGVPRHLRPLAQGLRAAALAPALLRRRRRRQRDHRRTYSGNHVLKSITINY